jgi:hypothetical protein
MEQYKIKQLEELLKEWFESADFDSADFLNKNKIAKILKQELSRRKHWKGKPRGANNSADTLNKGKINKEELEKQLANILRCECGEPIIRSGKAFMCSNICCNKSDQNIRNN